jgi:gliding motility-associated-like protein
MIEANSADRKQTVKARMTNTCWQHIAITRRSSETSIYINGILISKQTLTANPLNLDNSAVFSFSDSPCFGQDGTTRFSGLLDEVFIYNRALPPNEVKAIYDATAPDRLVKESFLIYEGASVTTDITNSCAANFLWTPATGVADPNQPRTTITPTDSASYTLQITDSLGCITYDTLQIDVLDPDDFDCEAILLPSAFTPNGDSLNDEFCITNAPIIRKMKSFEIFDRWGNKVFATNDPFASWNGKYKEKELNTGIYVYRISYECGGKTKLKMGEVNLIR